MIRDISTHTVYYLTYIPKTLVVKKMEEINYGDSSKNDLNGTNYSFCIIAQPSKTLKKHFPS